MRHYIFPAIALTALTALTLPAAANAQAHPPGHDRMGSGRGAMPAARIIELRDELALTAEQVARINGIQEQVREQNAPLLEQLAAARQEMQDGRRQLTDDERAQMRQRGANGMRARSDSAGRPGPGMPAELRPVMEQLRANTAGAMQQIQATLTAEQQQKLRELRPAPRRPAGHGEHAPGAARGRTRGAPRGAR